jgi:hypothetical protein
MPFGNKACVQVVPMLSINIPVLTSSGRTHVKSHKTDGTDFAFLIFGAFAKSQSELDI